ncbi:hypothetical protein CPB85DRAFT_1564267 [Mucidula mucida]|nr:hypothetical protein CPB85DRAFT_1564267 [Mucidula mucida]
MERALHTCSFHKKALLYSIRPFFLPPPEPQPSSRMHIAIVLYLVLYLLVSVSISAAYTMDSFPLTPSPSTSQTQSSNSAYSNSDQAAPTPAFGAGNSTNHFVASTPSSQSSSSAQYTQSSSSSHATSSTSPLHFNPEESATHAPTFGFDNFDTDADLDNPTASCSTSTPFYNTDMESEPQNGLYSSMVDIQQTAQINNAFGDFWFPVLNADDVSPDLEFLFVDDQPSTFASDIQITSPVSSIRGDSSNEDNNRPWGVPVQDTYQPQFPGGTSSTATGFSTSTNAADSALAAGMNNMSLFPTPLRHMPNYSPLNPSPSTPTFRPTRQFGYTPDIPYNLTTPLQPQSERSKGKQKEVQSERSKGKQREANSMNIEQTRWQQWKAEQNNLQAENLQEERKPWEFIPETGTDYVSDSSSDDDDYLSDGEIPSPAIPRSIAPLPRGRARRLGNMSTAGPHMTSLTSSSIPVDRSAAAAMTVDNTSFPAASPVTSAAQSNGNLSSAGPCMTSSTSLSDSSAAAAMTVDDTTFPSASPVTSAAQSNVNMSSAQPLMTSSTSSSDSSAAAAMTVDDTSFPLASPVPNAAQGIGSAPASTPVTSMSRQDLASQPFAAVPPSVPNYYGSRSSNNTGSVPVAAAFLPADDPASFTRIVEVVDDKHLEEVAVIQSRSTPPFTESLVKPKPASVPPPAPTAIPTSTAPITSAAAPVPTSTAHSTGSTSNPPAQLPTNPPSVPPLSGLSSVGVGSNYVSVPASSGVGLSTSGASSSSPQALPPSPEPSPEATSFSPLPSSVTPSPCTSPGSAGSSVSPQTPADLSFNNTGSLKAGYEAEAVPLMHLESPTLDDITQPIAVAAHPSPPSPQCEGHSGPIHTSTDLAEAELLLLFVAKSGTPVSRATLVDAASIPLPPSPTITPTCPLDPPVDAAFIPLPPSPTITPTPVIIVTPPLEEPITNLEKADIESAIKSLSSAQPPSVVKSTETQNTSSSSTPSASTLPDTVADGASTPPPKSKATKQKKAQAKNRSEPSAMSEKAGKVKAPSVQAVEASSPGEKLEEELRMKLRKQKADKEKKKKQKDDAEASNKAASTSAAPGVSSAKTLASSSSSAASKALASNSGSASSKSKASLSKGTPSPTSTSLLQEEAKKKESPSAPASSAASHPQPQRLPPRSGSVSPLLRKATTTAAAQAVATPAPAPTFNQAPVIPNVPIAPVFPAQQTPIPSGSGSGQVPSATSGWGQASLPPSFATATQQSSNGYPTSANTGGWPLPMGQPQASVQVASPAWNTQAAVNTQAVFDVDTDMQDATAPPPPLYQQVAPPMDVDMADAPSAWAWNPQPQAQVFQSQPGFQAQPATQPVFQTQPQTQSIFQSQPQTQSLFQSSLRRISPPVAASDAVSLPVATAFLVAAQSQPLFQSQSNAQPQAQAQASSTFFSSPPSYSTAQQQAQQSASKPLPFQTVETTPPVVDVPPPYASQPAPLFSAFQQQPSPWSSFKVIVEEPPVQPPRPPPKQIIIKPEYWEEFFHWYDTAPEAKRFPAYPFTDTDVPTWMMDLRDQFWALNNDLHLAWNFVCWCSRGTHFVTRLLSSKKYSEGAMLEAFIARGKDWEKYMYTKKHTPDMCGGGCKRTSR